MQCPRCGWQNPADITACQRCGLAVYPPPPAPSNEPAAGTAQGTAAHSGYPQGGHPQSGYPQGGHEQGGHPPGAGPQSGPPQSGPPPSGYPEGAGPHGGYPQGGHYGYRVGQPPSPYATSGSSYPPQSYQPYGQQPPPGYPTPYGGTAPFSSGPTSGYGTSAPWSGPAARAPRSGRPARILQVLGDVRLARVMLVLGAVASVVYATWAMTARRGIFADFEARRTVQGADARTSDWVNTTLLAIAGALAVLAIAIWLVRLVDGRSRSGALSVVGFVACLMGMVCVVVGLVLSVTVGERGDVVSEGRKNVTATIVTGSGFYVLAVGLIVGLVVANSRRRRDRPSDNATTATTATPTW